MENFRAALFDLDGTILDSMGVWEEIDIVFLEKRGFSVPEDYARQISVLRFEDAAVYTKERFALPESPQAIIDEWNEMALMWYGDKVGLKPYAAEYLKKLHDRGVKLAVATALPASLYTPCLTHNGIYALFDAFASTDEVGCGKERPDVYLLAAERLGAKPGDCMVFEDVLPGVLSAANAGMRVCGVYDACAAYAEQDIRKAAERYIMGFDELL